MLPAIGSMIPEPLPSSGSPWDAGFPAFVGTTSSSDSQTPVPPRFVAFAWRYRDLQLLFRVFLADSIGRELPRPLATGFFESVARSDIFIAEMSGPLRFLKTPCRHAVVRDPGQAEHRRPYACSVLPSDVAQRLNPDECAFRDLSSRTGRTSTACGLAVYASHPGLLPDHARLASGWWPPYPDGIDMPTRAPTHRGHL